VCFPWFFLGIRTLFSFRVPIKCCLWPSLPPTRETETRRSTTTVLRVSISFSCNTLMEAGTRHCSIVGLFLVVVVLCVCVLRRFILCFLDLTHKQLQLTQPHFPSVCRAHAALRTAATGSSRIFFFCSCVRMCVLTAAAHFLFFLPMRFIETSNSTTSAQVLSILSLAVSGATQSQTPFQPPLHPASNPPTSVGAAQTAAPATRWRRRRHGCACRGAPHRWTASPLAPP
jgi:hypothetical protein